MSSSSFLMFMESSSLRWTTTGWDTHICIPPLRYVATFDIMNNLCVGAEHRTHGQKF